MSLERYPRLSITLARSLIRGSFSFLITTSSKRSISGSFSFFLSRFKGHQRQGGTPWICLHHEVESVHMRNDGVILPSVWDD
ncbi:DNA polymerase lambda [Fusarium oxysporum f. sp. albedinis]|nr:DNA polymerase lambda [Fusarium oxysporum f. sp. albedinis]